MHKKYHVDPESVGLHRLGHAELARNGQRCGTCEWATGRDKGVVCANPTALGRTIKAEYRACIHYGPRTADDHAARLYRPEKKH